jgi:hypothetical protein
MRIQFLDLLCYDMGTNLEAALTLPVPTARIVASADLQSLCVMSAWCLLLTKGYTRIPSTSLVPLLVVGFCLLDHDPTLTTL